MAQKSKCAIELARSLCIAPRGESWGGMGENHPCVSQLFRLITKDGAQLSRETVSGTELTAPQSLG